MTDVSAFQPSAASPPPGWYPVASRRNLHRWWNGQNWRDQLLAQGRQISVRKARTNIVLIRRIWGVVVSFIALSAIVGAVEYASPFWLGLIFLFVALYIVLLVVSAKRLQSIPLLKETAAPANVSPGGMPAPGWYPVARLADTQRWWEGQRWGEQLNVKGYQMSVAQFRARGKALLTGSLILLTSLFLFVVISSVLVRSYSGFFIALMLLGLDLLILLLVTKYLRALPISG